MRGAPGAGGHLRPSSAFPWGASPGPGCARSSPALCRSQRPNAECPVGRSLGLLHPSGLSWGRGCLARVSEPDTYSYVHTYVHTHVHTRTDIHLETRLVCVCVHARYTPPCAHMHQDAHTWEDVHTGHAQADVETGPVTCEDGAGHLQALRDTAATTKGGGAPSRTRGAGAQRSETGRTAGNPTWGDPHTGRGCLTSPGPTRSAPAPTLGPRTEFCASGSLFLGNETFPKGIVVP